MAYPKRVKCIDVNGLPTDPAYPQLGAEYSATGMHRNAGTDCYDLANLPGSWTASRFVDVAGSTTTAAPSAKKRVRCKDAYGSMCAGVPALVVGNVYEVEKEEHRGSIYILVGVPLFWGSDRFDIVSSGILTYASANASSSPTTQKKAAASIDAEEERCKSILLGVALGNCACNLPKHQCWLHK